MFLDRDIHEHSMNLINPWRNILYDLLKYKSNPLLITKDSIYTADALWTLSRIWKELLLKFPLKKGDFLLLHIPKSEHFLANLVNSLFQNYPLILANPRWDLLEIYYQTKPRAVVTTVSQFERFAQIFDGRDYRYARIANQDFVILFFPSGNNNPDITFLLRTSGTTSPKWIGLTNREVFFNLNKHSKIFEKEMVMVSILPWFHAFGLILDLLSVFLKRGYIIVDDYSGKDLDYITFLSEKFPVSHMSMVPLHLENFLENGKEDFLLNLQSGIIGGAKIPNRYIPFLRKTKLRVGYGQTEAGPGISIGKEGDWDENYVGEILCEVSFGRDGEIFFRGENVFQYELKEGNIHQYNAERWVATGDLGFAIDNRLYFEGRKSHIIKLKNGKWFNPVVLEEQIKKDLQIDNFVILHEEDLILVVDSNPRVAGLADTILNSYMHGLKPYIKDTVFLSKENFFKTNKGDFDRNRILSFIRKEYEQLHRKVT